MDTLAVELVQLIALHLATQSPSTTDVRKDLVSLINTSRLFHYAVNPYTNPHLYAEIFRRTFDTSALYRRFPTSQLNATALTHELLRRWACISRVRKLSIASGYAWTSRRYAKADLLEDLMTMYLMFTESDGGNAKLLLRHANILGYLEQFKQNCIGKMRLRPEMPEESEENALWLWLCWFTLDYYKCITESDEVRINFDYLITPFVLGVFQYANTFAPWSCPILPLAAPSLPSSSPNTSSTPLVLTNPSPSPNDLIPLGPRPLSTAIPGGYLSVPAGTYYSSHGTNGTNGVRFSFPLLHHAAVQLCLAQEDRLPMFQPGAVQPTNDQLLNLAFADGFFPSAMTLADQRPGLPPFFDRRAGRVARDAYTPDYMRVKFPCIVDSRRWDNEWARLAGCRDPLVSIPKSVDVPKYRWTPGRMTGEWDGRFMIPALDSYNRLLDALQPLPTNHHHLGEPVREYPVNILEEVHRLHNYQSWSIDEYHHRPYAHLPNAVRPGKAINAHLPGGILVERAAEIWDPTMKRWKNGILVRANGVESYYEAIPSSERSSSLSIPPSTSGLPILLFGHLTTPPRSSPAAAHNSWFEAGATISGTVRPWDGLVTLKATNDPRAGDWVYNGYLVGEGDRQGESGNWVGRWRDAHSDARTVAWEGVFVMRKRGE
ncbi:hypothetical protein M407DRAFT_6254 [Tulasnella calospora MUT 4182]|uniref:Uncharacterized protein n=1 Tax=Tulasnella calospora MUT 4182 TaxID=1051891 RepID=A0A0C3QMY0_9AGAM|nr:hypothetical protein M407DRAFT_6254 [Tulasnella calospora MUT 4182]